jgi:transcriptional regulator with XRE-family HTH domain
MKFSDRLVKLRKARKITQTDLAEMVGMTARTIQNYESGTLDTVPNRKVLKKLADALQVDEAAFLNDEIFEAYQAPYDDAMLRVNEEVHRLHTTDKPGMLKEAFVSGFMLPFQIFNEIIDGKKRAGRKKLIQYLSNLQKRCYIEIGVCQTLIYKYRERYKRNLELRESSAQIESSINSIIDLIFAYQDYMFIWYEQSMCFKESLRLLQDLELEGDDPRIRECIKEAGFMDKEKGELLESIKQLEEKLASG